MLLSALVSLLVIAYTPSVIFKHHQHQNFGASLGLAAEPISTCAKPQVIPHW